MANKKEREPVVDFIFFLSLISIISLLLFSAFNGKVEKQTYLTICILLIVIYLAYIFNQKVIFTQTEKAKNLFNLGRLAHTHQSSQVKHLQDLMMDRQEYKKEVLKRK